MKQTQMGVVRMIVKENQPVRTEQVKRGAMYYGVSDAGRYLRWLKENGEIVSYKRPSDRTLTWCMAN